MSQDQRLSVVSGAEQRQEYPVFLAVYKERAARWRLNTAHTNCIYECTNQGKTCSLNIRFLHLIIDNLFYHQFFEC